MSKVTPHDAVSLINSITYKPGSVVKAGLSASAPAINITLQIQVQDREAPDRLIPIQSSFVLKDSQLIGMARSALLEFIRRSLWKLETHESDEWFLYAGERIFDPHIKEKK